MKVLLTGATGFIGQYVLRILQQNEIEVLTIGRTQPHGSVAFIKANLLSITDFTPLVQQTQATHLLHLAWYTEHGKYWTSPINLRWLESTTRLVEAFCNAGGQRVVIAGTCAEYDWTYGYCREDSTPLNPGTLYGISKDATRRLVEGICAQYQVPCAWGRVFLPFGRGESTSRLIPSLIEVFRGRRPPFSINANAYRDFLHASDVAKGFFGLITQDLGGIYNICSGKPTQLGQLVATLASLLDSDPEPILALAIDRIGDPPLLVGENIKLNALGWQPELSLTQGLARSLLGK